MTVLTDTRLAETILLELEVGAIALAEERRLERVQEAETDQAPLLAWTERHRVINDRPLRPTELPWLRDLYACGAPEIVVQKASQVFVSEWMVSTALWVCDSQHAGRGNALYVFPTQAQGDDFSQARIGSAIEQSPHLSARALERGADGKAAASRVRLRRLGAGHLYLRGADRRRQLLSIDADCLLLDEVDEFRDGTIDVARKRLSSSLAPLIRMASTPTYPSGGIAAAWGNTTRRRYLLRCGCGHEQALVFPDNLTEDGRLVCARCRGPLECDAEGRWEAEDPTAAVEGFHVSRLYSPRTDLPALAKLGHGILAGHVSDPTAVQEFYNQDLGLPHAPAGGSLNTDVLSACVAAYSHPAAVTTQPVTMGVDVGAVLHVYIKAPSPDQEGTPGATRLLFAGTVPNEIGPDGQPWPGLDELMQRYNVRLAVVDAMPEDNRAVLWSNRWRGRVFRCFYPNPGQWRYESASVWNTREHVVLAHRTRSLDATFDRFYRREEELPREAPWLPGLFPQLTAPVRILSTDAAGRTVARYDEGRADDHFCFGAGTPVLTEDGWRPIEQVNEGQLAWTRRGWRRVLRAGMTRSDAATRRYVLSNGVGLIATPNHPVWVEGRGFVPIHAVTYADILLTWDQSSSTTAGSPSVATPIARGAATACISHPASPTAVAASSGYTRKSTRTSTAQSLRAITSTIATTIRSITIRGTSTRSRCPSTGVTTHAGSGSGVTVPPNSPISPEPASCRTPGVEPTPAARTRGDCSPRSTHDARRSFAPTADGRTRRASPGNTASVLVPATVLIGALLVWITRGGLAPCAGRPSGPTGTRPQRRARGPARTSSSVSVIGSEPAGRRPVYNLEIEGDHEYFAAGVLVHNCHAANYSELARTYEPHAEPPEGRKRRPIRVGGF